MSVLYVYRCPACGKRGEVHHPDDSYDGAAATCEKCYGPVALEWDGGVTFEVAPHDGGPTPDEIKSARLRGRRTQASAAALLGVKERQVQRWEAGQAPMPIAAWLLLRRSWGYRYPSDFAPAPGPLTRGCDSLRDRPRDTIERGDVVELQPVGGPRLRAIVCLDRVHDGLVDEESYGAYVTEFVGAAGVGDAYRGFFIGERVTFARHNVLYLEQRAPQQQAVTRPIQAALSYSDLLVEAETVIDQAVKRATSDTLTPLDTRRHAHYATGAFFLWAAAAKRLATQAHGLGDQDAFTTFEADKDRLSKLLDDHISEK